MSVSVPAMSSACSLPRALLGYEGSLLAASPRHHSSWGCGPIQVKQEPPSERDHDSSGTSGVSSMTHGSFLSATNTSPSSSSSAGSPRHPSPDPLQALRGMSQSTPQPPRASPRPELPNPPPPRTRSPGSVDDNSHSSSCSNSEDDGEDQVRQRTAMVSNGSGNPLTPEQGVPLHCQMCSFVTDSGEKLAEHINIHYELKCSLCEFSAASTDSLRSHLQEVHDLVLSPSPDQENHADNGFLDDQDDGVSTPKVNSQGKVKTFRCKQCEFVAVTKLDFWEHTKLHIKQEKLLTCPKCPFVTEYKHHLEYHLRNHFNSKPFKCDKCSYSCVNKSMLNSHLKSHSNVYQYRCADCTYATKYCHSLKLHLRKYGHQPSMVLNPDGTPNPLPIIDVYGTRRGPKTKTSKAAQAVLQQQQPQPQQPSQQQPPPPPPPGSQVPQVPAVAFPHGMFPTPYGLPPLFPYAPPQPPPDTSVQPVHRCSYCEFATTEAEVLAQHVFVHAESNLMQYFQANNNNYYGGQDDVKEYMSKLPVTAAPPASAPALAPARQPSPPAPISRQPSPPRLQSGSPLVQNPSSPSARSLTPSRPAPSGSIRPAGTPLDLSKPEHGEDLNSTSALAAHTKNRRKGRAFKLERIAMRLQHEAEPESKAPRLAPSAPAPTPTPVPAPAASPAARSPSPPTSPASATTSVKEEYNCSYCDIAFRDIVMYTMHMGYHGYQDPFQCNMCGQQTSDKVSFFLHIARSSHS